jgi:hypothetical protein
MSTPLSAVNHCQDALIAGNDLRSMSNETKSILLNREVIQVNQDPLGRAASLESSRRDGGVASPASRRRRVASAPSA